MIKKEELLRFYQNIESQKEQIKARNKDIKDAFDAFAKNNGVTVKALKKDFKNYLEYQKDKQEFLEVDTEADSLTQAWVAEYQDREAA